MSRFMKMYVIEQKLALRSCDMFIFGIGMPVGVLLLIAMIAGSNVTANASYTYLESAYASLIAVGICASAFMGIPLTLADYRDKKILKQFFVTPCSPLRILGAVILCNIVTAILSAVSVTIVATVFLGYRMVGNPMIFMGVWILTLTSMFSIGMLMASVCPTVKATNAITSLVYFPMLFLSGATIPYELFPKALQKVADVLPLTQGIRLMKEVAQGIYRQGAIGIVILLIGITIVCSVISVKTFKWE